jgi:hypothetical protein
MLLRLAYLGMVNVFALLRLLPTSSRDKDAEILALRHQLSVLQRQPGPGRVRFTPAYRAMLAALLHQLPRDVLKRLHLAVRPDTVLRWHRNMIARRHARRPRPRHPGRPRTVRSIRALVLRLVRDNHGWGYRRVHGELLVLGIKVAASAVWEILPRGRDRPSSRAQLRHVGRFPALPGRGPAGLRLLRDCHLVRGAAARARGDCARQPQDQDPGRHCPVRAGNLIRVTRPGDIR